MRAWSSPSRVRSSANLSLMTESDYDRKPTTELLVAFEKGDPEARRILPDRLEDSLHAIVSQIGFELPSDQHNDVVQKTWMNVLEGDSEYDPSRSSPLTYLKLHMRNAIRQVRASYARAGEPKRLSSRNETENWQTVPIEEAPISCRGSDANQDCRVDAKIVLEAAERVFGDQTSAALKRLSWGCARERAASAAGYSRRTLGRRISDLRNYL